MLGQLRTPQFEVRLYASVNLLELERLGDIVDPSRLKSFYLVFGRVQSTNKNHGNTGESRVRL